MIDKLKSIEVFVHVAELGSFTAAAAALRLPNARVTTHIQELEAHLGVRLLNRTTRRLSLTDDGSAVRQRAIALLQEMQDLESTLKSAASKPAGRLKVDVPAVFGRHVLAPALPEFFKNYPDMQLELGSSDRPVDLVAEGVDCVIRGGNVFDELLVARPLGKIPVITCAAPSYLKQYGTPKIIADLDKHRFVNFHSAKTGKIFPFDFAKDDIEHHIHRPHWVSCNDASSYLAAGTAGMGLMQTPHTSVVDQQLRAGSLVRVLHDWDAGVLPMVILYPRNRHLTARVRVFADWVAEIFKINLIR